MKACPRVSFSNHHEVSAGMQETEEATTFLYSVYETGMNYTLNDPLGS